MLLVLRAAVSFFGSLSKGHKRLETVACFDLVKNESHDGSEK